MTPEPRFVTSAELEALEGRIINRIAELESRLVRDISGAFWRQVLLILPLYAVLLATILAGAAVVFNLAERLPR